MITLIGGEKGGSGKSTLATNLAVWYARAGRDVLLLDCDQQGTSALWATERAEHADLPAVHCVQRHGNVFNAVKDLGERYEEVVIDAGGRDSEELRSALVVAHKLYTPLRPSQSDLWTVSHVDSLIKLARGMNPQLEAYAVLSIAPTNPRINEIEEAVGMLAEFEQIRVCETVVRDRKAFRDAMCFGRGVLELSDDKASAEIESFAQEVCNGSVEVQSKAVG